MSGPGKAHVFCAGRGGSLRLARAIALYWGGNIFQSIFQMNLIGDALRLIGCVLLVSGFFVVAAALVLMPALAARFGFVAAGLGVEILGLGLLMNGHKALEKERR